MKTGRLSDKEKLKIQDAIIKGLNSTQIAKDLDRNCRTIQNYVKSFKERFADIFEEAKPSNAYEKTMQRLIDNGFSREKAMEKISKALKDLEGEEVEEDKLYNMAVRSTSVRDTMITKSKGGTRDVAIMTDAASQRLDAIKGNKKKKGKRDIKKHVFETK